MPSSVRKGFSLIFLLIVGIASVGGIIPAAAEPGVVGSFEIDGDLEDTAAGEPRDWDSISEDPEALVITFDDPSGQGDDSFGDGSKLLEPIGWRFVTQNVPKKDDLLTGGVALREIDGHNWLYAYSRRQFDKGSAFIGYEFNRSSSTFDNDGDPATAEVPVRTSGDLMIFLQVQNGGTETTIDVYRWSGDQNTGTWDPIQGIAPVRGTDWEATTGQLPGGTFLLSEAAMNLDMFDQTPTCPGLATVWMHTVSSHTFNSATMKDRTLRHDLDLSNCGSITIDKIDDLEEQPLDGAVFELRADDGDSVFMEGTDPQVATCTTGSGGTPGRCTFSTVSPGAYWVREIQAPPGFDADPTVHGPITLAAHEHHTISQPFVNHKLLPEFEVSKSASPATVDLSDGDPSNDVVTYTVTVANVGDGEGSTFVEDDYDQAHLSELALITEGGSDDGDVIRWNDTGMIPPHGGTATFTYTARVTGTYDAGDAGEGCDGEDEYPVVNVVSVEGDAATATVCVHAAPRFTVEKTADKNIVILDDAEQVTYTITVTNIGLGEGSTSVVDDYDQAHLTSINGIDPASGVDNGDTITWADSGVLAPNGGSAQFSYTGTITGTYSGPSGTGGCDEGSYPVVNIVTVHGDDDSKTVCVVVDPEFRVTKEVGPSEIDLSDGDTSNDTVTYTVTVENIGKAEGSTLVVDDYDQAHLADIVLVTPGGTDDGDTITWSSGVLAPNGGSATFIYTARITGDYTGPSGGSDCGEGRFPVVNIVTVDGDDDAATVCVLARPDLGVQKSVSPDSVDLSDGDTSNDTVTYSITVTNHGAAEGSTLVVDDYDQAHLADFVLVTPGGTDDGDTITWSSGVLAPNGGSATFTYTARVIGPFASNEAGAPCDAGSFPVVNAVTVEGDSDSAVVCASARPVFEVSKAADPVSVDLADDDTSNDTVTYTITVTNVGQAEGGTSVVDDYDQDHLIEIAGITPGDGTDDGDTITWTSGSIPVGDSETFSYTGRIVGPFAADDAGEPCEAGSYPVVNIVSVAGDEAQATVCASAEPDFKVAKSADPTTVDLSDDDPTNDTMIYTITVTNAGEAEGATTVVDDYDENHLTDIASVTPVDGVDDGDTITWASSGPIAPQGGSVTLTYTARVIGPFTSDESGPACENVNAFPVVNLVTVSGDSASSTVCANASPDLRVSKTSDKTVEQLGQDVTYTITVSNVGEGPGSTPVSDDYDEAHLTFITGIQPVGGIDDGDTIQWAESGTIEPGDEVTFSYTGTLTGSFTGPDEQDGCGNGEFPVVNLVTIDGDDDSNIVCVPADPEFVVTKSAEPASIDLSDGDTANDTVTYTITVENIGKAQGSTGVVDDYDQDHLVDLQTDGDAGDEDTIVWDSGLLQPGESVTFTYTGRIIGPFTSDEAGPACENANEFPVVNVVTIDGDSDASTVCVHAAPKFQVIKVADPASVDLSDGDDSNDRVTYTITVSNVGQGPGETQVSDDYDQEHLIEIAAITPADGVDDGDTIVWASSGTIEPGTSAAFSFSGRIVGPFLAEDAGEPCPEGFSVVNTVAVDGAGDDTVVCVEGDPALRLTKTVRNVTDDGDFGPTATAHGGEVLEYRILVSNDGESEATGVIVTDPVPSQSAFLSCEPMVACGEEAGVVTWTVGSVTVGTEITLSFQVVLDEAFEPGFTLIGNVATATRDGGEGPASSTPTTVTVTELSKDICLTNPLPGGSITYSIPYGARGGDVAGVVLEDVLPGEVMFESASPVPTSAPAVGETGAVRWEFGSLADGTDAVATITGRISSEALPGDILTNVVTIAADGVPETTFTLETEVVGGGQADSRARGLHLNLQGADVIGPTPDSNEQNPDSALELADPVTGEIAQVDVLTVQEAESVDPTNAGANAIVTTGEVKLLDQVAGPGEVWLITATAVRAVSSSDANLATAGSSGAGSMLVNVTVDGQNLGTVTEPTTIEIVDPVLGTTTTVSLLEHEPTGAADGVMQPQGGVFSSGLSVTAIHVVVTNSSGDTITELKVGQTDSEASFLSGLACSEDPPRVSGTGFAFGTTGDETVSDDAGVLHGGEVARVMIPATGGHREATLEKTGPIALADLFIGSSDAAFTRSTGTTDREAKTAETDTHAQIHGLRLLGSGPDDALITADAIKATAHAAAAADGGSTSGDTVLENLVIDGMNVCEMLGSESTCRPEPGKTIEVPGALLVILNEQIHGEGTITVNAIRIIVLGEDNMLGLPVGAEIVVASAHAGARALEASDEVGDAGLATPGTPWLIEQHQRAATQPTTPRVPTRSRPARAGSAGPAKPPVAVLPEEPNLGLGV